MHGITACTAIDHDAHASVAAGHSSHAAAAGLEHVDEAPTGSALLRFAVPQGEPDSPLAPALCLAILMGLLAVALSRHEGSRARARRLLDDVRGRHVRTGRAPPAPDLHQLSVSLT